MAINQKPLLLDVDEKPEVLKGILLSFQHVFAMFGATILVPLILGMPVSVALFASGLGTLIYQVATKAKVPVYPTDTPEDVQKRVLGQEHKLLVEVIKAISN